MQKLTLFTLIVLLTFSASQISPLFAAEAETAQEVDWKVFGKNIRKALFSDNQGLQESGMQMLIQYGDKLDIGHSGVIEILRTYRNSKEDLQTRRLALTALPKTGSSIVMGYLRLAVDFEKSPVLKKQIEFINAENEK